MARIKLSDYTKCSSGYGKTGVSDTGGRMENGTITLEKLLVVLKQEIIYLACNLAITVLGFTQENENLYPHGLVHEF